MLPIVSLVILTLFTWAVAIWATFEEEYKDPLPGEKEQDNQKKTEERQYQDWRDAA